MCLREGAPFDSSFVLSTSRGENDHDSERIISFKADFHEKCGFYRHRIRRRRCAALCGSAAECDEVFSRWERRQKKNHTFEDVLIASKYGNQLFSSMSLGDVVLYLVLNESSDGERADLPMAVNSIAL